MNREAYELANRIKTETETGGDILLDGPGDVEKEKYKKYIMQKIQEEEQGESRRRKGKYRHMRISAAACAGVFLLAGIVFFGDEIHAMIRQISWNIGSALGTPEDLADYSQVVNTSVSDKGYVITLQEALVSEGELMVNYTLQRENGEPLDELFSDTGLLMTRENLYINGEEMKCASEMGGDFLDEEQKILGVVTKYFLFHVCGIDLAKENEFRIEFEQIGGEKGDWNFAFKADSSALAGDTKRAEIGESFMLPDGIKVTLDEFSSNKLEQRITYSLSARSRYTLVLDAEDSEGNRVEFSTRTQGDSGYMLNRTHYEAGVPEETGSRLDEEAETVTMTLYARKDLDENGQAVHDCVQIGEPFVIELP